MQEHPCPERKKVKLGASYQAVLPAVVVSRPPSGNLEGRAGRAGVAEGDDRLVMFKRGHLYYAT